jgi:hypothetical protein
MVGGASFDVIDKMKRRAAAQNLASKFELAADDLKKSRRTAVLSE